MPDTFSAKQVANRIGTDPKTLRKFLRSAASPYEAVGQGGRYEFPKTDLAEIKKNFLKWQKNKRPATLPAMIKKGTAQKPAPVPPAPNEDEDDLDREPTPEELAELEEDLEIDDV